MQAEETRHSTQQLRGAHLGTPSKPPRDATRPRQIHPCIQRRLTKRIPACTCTAMKSRKRQHTTQELQEAHLGTPLVQLRGALRQLQIHNCTRAQCANSSSTKRTPTCTCKAAPGRSSQHASRLRRIQPCRWLLRLHRARVACLLGTRRGHTSHAMPGKASTHGAENSAAAPAAPAGS